jgi:hypothetical protein
VSRRSHVVRTEDQGPAGQPRSLGGCTILCSVADCGNVTGVEATEIATINVDSSTDYQRVFVSATVAGIEAYVPDPPPLPGPGSWTVTFECPVEVPLDGSQWASMAWNPQSVGGVTLTHVHYWGSTGHQYPFWFTGIEMSDDWGDYQQWAYFYSGDHDETVDPPLEVKDSIRLSVGRGDGTVTCILTMYSEHGEGQEDVHISEVNSNG